MAIRKFESDNSLFDEKNIHVVKRPTIVIDGKKIETNVEKKHQEEIKGKTRELYDYLLENSGFHGVRELQRSLDYSSPSSVSYHLNRLIDAKLITKTEFGKYGIKEHITNYEAEQVSNVIDWLPVSMYLASGLFLLSFISVLFYWYNVSSSVWFVIYFTLPSFLGTFILRQSLIKSKNLQVM